MDIDTPSKHHGPYTCVNYRSHPSRVNKKIVFFTRFVYIKFVYIKIAVSSHHLQVDVFI